MAITIENRFSKFKSDFKRDTNLDADTNMSLYIQYYNARCSDTSTQILVGLTTQVINKLNTLPGDTRLQIAEMIREHEVIKQLLQKKS